MDNIFIHIRYFNKRIEKYRKHLLMNYITNIMVLQYSYKFHKFQVI